MLEQAARSDRLVAQEYFQHGGGCRSTSLPALASLYVPKSSLPAEAAIPAVLSASIQHSRTTLQGHTNAVLSAIFSPDGCRVLTASGDQTARLWEADTGKLLATFQGHGGGVRSAVFSPTAAARSPPQRTKPGGSGSCSRLMFLRRIGALTFSFGSDATLAFVRTVEKITGIKLQAWFGRQDLHESS